MYFILFSSVSLLFSLAAAETTTFSIAAPGVTSVSPNYCGAQAVLDACIISTSAIASACSVTDYNCLCQKHTDILTCFNNCPNDPRRSATLATQSSYCSNASQFSSATSIAISHSVSASSTPTASSFSVSSITSTSSTTSTEKDKPTSTSDSGASKVTAAGLLLLGAGLALI